MSLVAPEFSLAREVVVAETRDQQWQVRLNSVARRASLGETSAWAELFDLIGARALRYAHTITRNTVDAEDALQGAWARLLANPQQLALVTFPWTYILTTVRHEALRICSRRTATTTEVEGPEEMGDELWPIDISIRQEMTVAIADSLQTLPSQQAEVVVLKLWEELTFDEISVMTGVSPHTAASRYRYALGKLTPLLSKWVDVPVTASRETSEGRESNALETGTAATRPHTLLDGKKE